MNTAETKRGAHFARIVTTAQALMGLRFGLTLQELAADVEWRSGEVWHTRTIHRDLQLLQYLGVVEQVRDRWRWCAAGSLFEQPAEKVREAADWQARTANLGRDTSLEPVDALA